MTMKGQATFTPDGDDPIYLGEVYMGEVEITTPLVLNRWEALEAEGWAELRAIGKQSTRKP